MSFATRARGATVALVVAMLAAASGVVSTARAGVWAQVACVNPNGSAATSQGWSAFVAGAGYDAAASSACAPGTPMSASLGAGTPAPVFTSAGLQYTPPIGSTLVGGSLQMTLSADGSGTDAAADAEIDEPAQTSADARLRCTAGSRSCGASATDVSGTFKIPANHGGDLYVTAGCIGGAGFACDTGGRSGNWALAQVSSAQLLLQNTSSPSARDLRGSLLRRTVHGNASLRLAASDPAGPGVYRIAVVVDGVTIHDATPDRNRGACVPVGTDSVTGALEFDAAQPCPEAETTTLRIATARLPDGVHHLAVIITDAAGNSTTVLRRKIVTDNPELTPRPARGLRARFAISWRWARTVTELRTIAAVGVKAPDRVAVSCTGKACPSLPSRPVPASGLSALLRRLRGADLHSGDALLITVAAPHQRAERIRLTIRRGSRPQARLLG